MWSQAPGADSQGGGCTEPDEISSLSLVEKLALMYCLGVLLLGTGARVFGGNIRSLPQAATNHRHGSSFVREIPRGFPGIAVGGPDSGVRVIHQGISAAQGSNPHLLYLLHWQTDSIPLVPRGKLTLYVAPV